MYAQPSNRFGRCDNEKNGARVRRAPHSSQPNYRNQPVGWVERSDTHQLHFADMKGFAGLNPSYVLRRRPEAGALRQRILWDTTAATVRTSGHMVGWWGTCPSGIRPLTLKLSFRYGRFGYGEQVFRCCIRTYSHGRDILGHL